MINEAERRSRPTVGALLSERRLERGLEIVDIARETRIPQRHLNALEQGRHELLPALAYSTGFVRTYARLLGLDADAMVRQYRSERPQQEEGPDRSSGLIEGADETKLPGRAVLFASLAALGLLLAGVIYYATRDQTEPPPAAPVAAAEPRATAPVLSDSAAPPVEETVRPPEPLPGPPLEASPAGAAQPPATTAAAAPAPAPAALPAMPGASGPVVAGVSPVGLVLRANEDNIRAMVHDRSGSLMRWTGLDETVANKIIDGLDQMLADMAHDPGHPLRAKAEEGLRQLAFDMQFDEAMQARVERLKVEIIENPAMQRWLDGLWEQARGAMLRIARDPEAGRNGGLGEALRQLGTTLQEDARLGATINRFVRRAVVGTVADYGDGIVRLVSETIRGWDARTVTRRLENAVGRDLQYIRINGTIVGGLVGVLLHTIDLAI